MSCEMSIYLLKFALLVIMRAASFEVIGVGVSDIQALESLYNSTQGSSWLWRPESNTTGMPWNFSKTSLDEYVFDPCKNNWQGVCCSGNQSEYAMGRWQNVSILCSHTLQDILESTMLPMEKMELTTPSSNLGPSIVGIVLPAFGLEGTLPAQFFELSGLKFLEIRSNHRLAGKIPSAVGRLSNLVYFDLQNNDIHGEVPSSFSMLISLSILYLNNNKMSGTISTSLSMLTCLKVVDLGNNHFIGTIPVELAELSALTVLGLSSNQLVGTIPAVLAQASLLLQLLLNNNNLQGTLPTALSNLSSLIGLYVNNNVLTGTLPTCFGLLTSLQVMNCAVNQLGGALPYQLSGLQKLTTLLLHRNLFTGWPLVAFSDLQSSLITVDLSENSFSGSFPTALFLLPQMQSISLVSNCFVGYIPTELCSSTSLQFLGLDGLTSGSQCRRYLFGSSASYVVESYLQGTVPPCLFSMTSLRVLQLSGNGLSGMLPDFTISSSLLNLTLSHNRLSGPIPISFQRHDFSLLDLSFNKLSGTVLEMGEFFSSSWSNSTSLDQAGAVVNEKELILQVNRLSGFLPASFVTANNINIVNGNLFDCNNNNAKFPINDPSTRLVQCGSSELTLVLAVWVGSFLLLGVFILTAVYKFEMIGNLSNSNDELSSSSSVEIFTKTMSYYMIVWSSLLLIIGLLFDLTFKYVNNQQFSTHTFQYAYTPSLAFVTGEAPALATMIFVMALMTLVYVMLTNRSAKTQSEQQQLQWRVWLAVLAVTVVDWIIMVLANVAYISIVLYYNDWKSVMGQIALTVFKLFVNGWVLPPVLRRIVPRQQKQAILTGLLLSNNLLIPMFTIMCTEPNCFSDLFTLSPAVSCMFAYIQPCYYGFTSGECIGIPATVQLSYQPPFIYTYQCSSNMLTTYLPVFAMMYFYIGLIQPLMIACLTIGNTRYQSAWCMRGTAIIGCDIMLPGGVGGNDEELLDAPQIGVMFMCHAVTMLTFGTAYPLLSVLICTAVCVEAAQWRVLILNYRASYKAVTDDAKREAMERRLSVSCLGLGMSHLSECRWMVMTVMALFFSFFLMDMAGDTAHDSWARMIWAPVSLMLWPVMIFVIAWVLHHLGIDYPFASSTRAFSVRLDDFQSSVLQSHDINANIELTSNPMTP